VDECERVDLGTDPELLLLAELLDCGVELDGQVVEVAAATWAIAGRITYDGEVIVGEFSEPERARWLLSHLGDIAAAVSMRHLHP
jgi:hypothetical protein